MNAVPNASLALRERAAETPGRCAVRTLGRAARALDFAGLEREVDGWAHALLASGVRPGDRCSLFVPPGVELLALFHALLRVGAPPVLIDPGIGRRELLSCIERTAPRVLIGAARAHVARLAFPRAFRSVELALLVGGGLVPRARALRRLAGEREFPIASERELAAILFTSGSTGPAKGVLYTHSVLRAQAEALRTLYQLEPGQVDCCCFPLFAFFDQALGLTSVFPELDPRRPACADPARIVEAIETAGASFAFGSPAIWRNVVPWMERAGRRFSRLARVAIAGAPVPPALVLALEALLPEGGAVHTPYGATEVLPVSDIGGRELAALRARIEGGEGSCVGRPVPGIELELIRITDEPVARFSEELRVAPGEPGEICVRGPAVTRGYLDLPDAERAARIPDGAGSSWHRMGDVGRLDPEGRLWFLGRKRERLDTDRGLLLPVPLENAFERCPGVARTALVGVGPRGKERARLVVEPARGARPRALVPMLRARAAELADGARIEEFLFHPALPVDARHNAKIRREELKLWAERRARRPRPSG